MATTQVSFKNTEGYNSAVLEHGSQLVEENGMEWSDVEIWKWSKADKGWNYGFIF